MISFQGAIIDLTNVCWLLYNLFAIFFLLLLPFLKNKRREECYNLLYALNTLMFWVCLFNFCLYARELWISWYGQNAYEQWAFLKNDPQIFGFTADQWLYFSYATTLAFIVFIFRKWRMRVMNNIIFLLIMNLTLIMRWASQAAGYHPPELVFPSEPLYLAFLYLTIITGLYILVYWVAYKRNRLPFPSLFLKRNVQ